MIPTPPGGPSEETGPGQSPPRRRPRVPPSAPFAVAVVAACWVTGFLAVNLLGSSTHAGDAVRLLFPRVGQSQAVDPTTVSAAWDVVRNQYWRSDVSGDQATQSAVSGIIDQLRTTYGDRFSSFYTSRQYQDLQNSLGGRRNGSVGIELEARCDGGAICPPGGRPSVVDVVGVLHNQPAEKAGIHRGDILVKIGGKPMSSFGPDPDTQINTGGDSIRGDASTTVTLTVQRGPQTLDITVARADLSLPSVFSQRFGTVVDVQVTAFDDHTGDDVKSALRNAFGAGAAAVVLDLRHNPGGLVSEAQAVASQFLTPSDKEQDVVVRRGRINGSDPSTAQTVERDQVQGGGVAPSQKLAVLVDGDSASAAEIVAAALHDYHRATVVGEKTFGKGSVQEDFPLPDGSDLHLTVEKWFGPAGESIDGTGITPDRTVTLPSEDARFRLDAQAPDPVQDTQLQAALAAVAGP